MGVALLAQDIVAVCGEEEAGQLLGLEPAPGAAVHDSLARHLSTLDLHELVKTLMDWLGMQGIRKVLRHLEIDPPHHTRSKLTLARVWLSERDIELPWLTVTPTGWAREINEQMLQIREEETHFALAKRVGARLRLLLAAVSSCFCADPNEDSLLSGTPILAKERVPYSSQANGEFDLVTQEEASLLSEAVEVLRRIEDGDPAAPAADLLSYVERILDHWSNRLGIDGAPVPRGAVVVELTTGISGRRAQCWDEEQNAVVLLDVPSDLSLQSPILLSPFDKSHRSWADRLRALPETLLERAREPAEEGLNEMDNERDDNALDTLDRVREVKTRLCDEFLSTQQEEHAARFGGASFLECEVKSAPPAGGDDEFSFRYLNRELKFGSGFLRSLSSISEAGADFDECIRLLLLHEAYHIGQNLTSYDYQGIGRAGFVLEALDYDADVASIECCYGWRVFQRERETESIGRSASLAEILCNLISMLKVFDGGTADLQRRRMRRYLIWLLQLARLRSWPGTSEFNLEERVVVEPVGGDDGQPEQIVCYVGGRLIRETDGSHVSALLATVQDPLSDASASSWEAFINKHRWLADRS